jgi:hypothetical protein
MAMYETLPDYKDVITVMLTPLSADSKGMAVVEKTATGFKVKELYQGTGSYGFDWEVKSVRKGFEEYQVIRQKRDLPQMMKTPQAPAAMPAPADEREIWD